MKQTILTARPGRTVLRAKRARFSAKVTFRLKPKQLVHLNRLGRYERRRLAGLFRGCLDNALVQIESTRAKP
jgi:hypothetical protein